MALFHHFLVYACIVAYGCVLYRVYWALFTGRWSPHEAALRTAAVLLVAWCLLVPLILTLK